MSWTTHSAPGAGTAPASGPGQLRGRVIVIAAILALACAALRTAWVSWQAYLPLLAVAAAGAILLSWLRRRNTPVAIAVAAGLFPPAAAMIVIGRGAQLTPLASLVDPFPRLLTSTVPAPASLDLLLPGLVITWAAGALGGWLLWGRHFFTAPLLVALLVMVPAELLTAGYSDPRGLITFALVAVLLAHWSNAFPGSPGAGSTPGLALAVVAAVIALLSSLVYLGAPFEPRRLITPPIVATEEPNPLPALAMWARAPDMEILRRGGDPQAQLRLVTLPDYDGVSFYSNSSYFPLGHPTQPLVPAGRYQRSASVSVATQSQSRWLPAPGNPIQLSAPDARVDPDTGSLLLPTQPQAGLSYTVTGVFDAASIDDVRTAGVPSVGRYLDLPNVPQEFQAYARSVTEPATTPYDQAKRLEQALRTGRGFSAQMPGGTSYARLHTFLFAPPGQGGQLGTSEQFAAAYAVLGRTIGLPTRVVVGFGPGTEVPDGSGARVVRGADALAWPEVYFNEFGWMPFAPTPDIDDAAPEVPQTAQDRGEPPPPPPGQAPPPEAQHDPFTADTAEPDPLVPWQLRVALIVTAAGVLTLFVARRLRRRRHRQAGAIGAWEEVVDAMRLAGSAPDAYASARARAAVCGSPQAKVIAAAAEAQAFGPQDVGHLSASDPPAVSDTQEQPLWDQANQAAGLLRRRSRWWRRWVWELSPAPWHPRVAAAAVRVRRRLSGLRRLRRSPSDPAQPRSRSPRYTPSAAKRPPLPDSAWS